MLQGVIAGISMTDSTPGNPDGGERYLPGYGQSTTRVMASRSAASHAAFFTPHLRSGMRLLDCGCGPGSITIDLARLVAPGETVGIDLADNQLELARNDAQRQRVPSARFESASIYALPFPDASFDAVFSHAAVEHLANPQAALREMCRVLKNGGIFGIRDSDRGGELFWPQDELLTRFHDLWSRLYQHNGSDPYFGRKLRALLNEVGLKHIEASASYECHGTPETVQFAADAIGDFLGKTFVEQITELGWMDRSEVEAMAAKYRAWGESPDAYWVRSWCEAVGWK